ncbi:MAG TPA: GGDEF domain-containing protein [Pyrinomonadaceae bacterium]|nr:GGDEF domain-containing protein [Pyrinomonadaceae bacterium]
MQPKDKRTIEKETRTRGRVLVISETSPVTLTKALEAIGLDVVGVAGGAAALVSLQRSRPHVVIAITPVKGISSRELARMLAQAQERISLVLAGSEAATLERRLSALSVGISDYFQLPNELPLLLERTKHLVAEAQAFERLRAEADLDSLTGLSNRRRFRTSLIHELERWRRYGVPCALLLLDIDLMKSINDQYGHTAGDLVLRHIADMLLAASRDNDTAARVGGEEFTLLLANASAEKAQAVAERLRLVISASPVEQIGSVTVSIGVAACPVHANTERALYSASDRALYMAKNAGRNRVEVAPPMQSTLPGVGD